MSQISSSKNSITTNIKLYLFPSLVTIVSMLIWRDVSELRNDVKMLLAQSNIDKTKIEQLEKDVKFLEQAVFNKKLTVTHVHSMSDRLLFKHEDIFDLNKYTPKS